MKFFFKFLTDSTSMDLFFILIKQEELKKLVIVYTGVVDRLKLGRSNPAPQPFQISSPSVGATKDALYNTFSRFPIDDCSTIFIILSDVVTPYAI